MADMFLIMACFSASIIGFFLGFKIYFMIKKACQRRRASANQNPSRPEAILRALPSQPPLPPGKLVGVRSLPLDSINMSERVMKLEARVKVLEADLTLSLRVIGEVLAEKSQAEQLDKWRKSVCDGRVNLA